MGTITSGIGLVSGINSKDIIDQLISLEQRPKTTLLGRKAKVDAQKLAYQDILNQLKTIETAGRAFGRPTTFTAAAATSSDEDVLTATTTAGAAVGTFQFQVARLVTAQQSITAGFADPTALVGAGDLTIEMGGGNLNAQTPLSQLNGGDGVRRGQFRVTDRSGKSAVIDVRSAVTVEDVVKRINTSLDVSVRASVKGDKLVLTDTTGQALNDLKVEDLADGHAAADLGLAGSAASATLTGSDVVRLGANLSLASLNDGRGVRLNRTGHDFVVTARDGSQTNVTLGATARTVGDAIKAINDAGGSKFKASLSASGNGITLTDTTGGGGALSVAAANADSKAAADLGLLTAASGATITGEPLLAGLGTVLISSLRGGTGLDLGEISIKNRAGTTRTVDLSSATSVQDILDTINATSGLNVTASLKPSGNGIQLADASGGTGNLVVADVDATTAEQLGIKGTFDATKPAAVGKNLQLQWVSENTLLSSYNGGRGVTPGAFTIQTAAGATVEVNLTAGTFNTLGDVIKAINDKNAGVKASINANGDGLLLTDTSGGAAKLKVTNKTGTTATDLNIAGEAKDAQTTIDGSFEKTVAITATDKLTDVQQKLRDLSFGVGANIINDGSGQAPHRLSLTAFNGGRAGRVSFDGGTTALAAQNLVEAQDAAVFVGGADAVSPLLVTSSKNQLANVIPGVTVDLHSASAAPVTLNVARDPDSVVGEVKKFTETFNTVVGKITELTKYDVDKQQGGLLLGDGTVQQVQSQLYVALQSVVQGAGRYRILADVGIKLGEGAKIEFDEAKFRSAFATDPEAVKNLFSQAETGIGALVQKTMKTLTDPVDGVVVRQNKTLDDRSVQFQGRMDALDKLIAQKRARLERQFAQMESVLAGLQSQQQALGSLSGIAAAAPRASG